MAFWRCCVVSCWRSVTVALWHCDFVEAGCVCRCGIVALLRCGVPGILSVWHCVALCHCGAVVAHDVWRCGVVVAYPFSIQVSSNAF